MIRFSLALLAAVVISNARTAWGCWKTGPAWLVWFAVATGALALLTIMGMYVRTWRSHRVAATSPRVWLGRAILAAVCGGGFWLFLQLMGAVAPWPWTLLLYGGPSIAILVGFWVADEHRRESARAHLPRTGGI